MLASFIFLTMRIAIYPHKIPISITNKFKNFPQEPDFRQKYRKTPTIYNSNIRLVNIHNYSDNVQNTHQNAVTKS